MYRKIWMILVDVATDSGPMTSLEIDREAECDGKKIESHKRMAEMVRQDLVEECEERICGVSGLKALTYRATMRPRQIDSKTGKDSLRQELSAAKKTIAEQAKRIAELEKINADLCGKSLVDWGMGGALFDNRKHD